jgi:hypothetical protein
MTRPNRVIAIDHQFDATFAVYNRADEAPTDAAARDEYCTYVGRLLERVPNLAAIVIWNEANSPRYWPVTSGAAGYCGTSRTGSRRRFCRRCNPSTGDTKTT